MKTISVCLLVLLAMLSLSPARAGQIYGQINYDTITYNNNRNGQALPLQGTAFSLHAGANVRGRFNNNGNGTWILNGGTTSTGHDPIQAGAADTTFPASYQQSNPPPFIKYIPVPARLPAGVTYATVPKNFGVLNAAGARLNLNGTFARGYGQVEFTQNGNKYTFDASSSSVQVTRGDGTPSGNAANLISDPWTTYSPVRQGDVLGGSVSLSKTDFTATIKDEPTGEVMGSVTVGSNFPTTTDLGSSAPGRDSEGQPIVFQLGLDFHPGQLDHPGVSLSFDPSYQFFDPDRNVSIEPRDLLTFVTNRIDNALTLDLTNDPTGNTVALTGDLTIFDWTGTAVQDGPVASIDEVDTSLATTAAVPEPATLIQMITAGAALAVVMLRRRKKGKS